MGVAIVAIIAFVVILIVLASRCNRTRSDFTGLGTLVGDNSPCRAHCLIQDGQLMDTWDCCDCLSITSGQPQTPMFRKCMCKYGYDNFCFKEETNYLLSQ